MEYNSRMLELRESKGVEGVISLLSKKIGNEIKSGKQVLWLIGGGSSIDIAAAARRGLPSDALNKLEVSLTDERFGPRSHSNSNWQALIDAGFEIRGLQATEIIKDQDLAAETLDFDRFLKAALEKCDFTIGLIGIGADSHIAGIKPGSLAVKSHELAIGYRADDFERITMTFEAIKKLDLCVAYLKEKDKKQVIQSFKYEYPLDSRPSQILKQVKKAIIFVDTNGG